MTTDTRSRVRARLDTAWSRAPELVVAFSPEAGFRAALHTPRRRAAWYLVQQLAIAALVIGFAVSTMATQRATLGSVTSATLSWSWVLAVQVAIAAAMVFSATGRSVTRLQALSLWFTAHVPYSLWMFVVSGLVASSVVASAEVLIASAVVPSAWTAVLVAAYSRTVLGSTRAGAWRRAAAHQAMVWIVALSYVTWAAGGWFQVSRGIGRLFS